MRYLSLVFAMIGSALIGCNSPVHEGSGKLGSDKRTLTEFTSVELVGVGKVTARPGDSTELTIEADENLLPYVQSAVTSKKLRVGVQSGSYNWRAGFPSIGLESSSVTEFSLRGQTQLNLQAEHEAVKITADGQCQISLTGRIDDLTVALTGQCSIDAKGAQIGSITGRMDGQCELSHAAGGKVDIKTSGTSVVRAEPAQ